MQVVLKVVGGKNDGREIAISVPRFIIGRGETAHLRPASDLVSREHCAIEVGEGKVTVNDLASRNGTFVNGKQLEQVHVARAGDSIRIGRLQFQLLIDAAKAGAKKPKVSGVVEAAARTAASKKESLEDSITDWLLDDSDEEETPDTDEKKLIASAETIQLNLDETTQFSKSETEQSDLADSSPMTESESLDESSLEDSDSDSDSTNGKKKKSKPKKLPPLPKFQHDSSKSAADDVLKKFFNRR
jgi:pSer/pThr/pTyr-binding forkhead associated (FHA) protein